MQGTFENDIYVVQVDWTSAENDDEYDEGNIGRVSILSV